MSVGPKLAAVSSKFAWQRKFDKTVSEIHFSTQEANLLYFGKVICLLPRAALFLRDRALLRDF